jgi:hypothetical protein
MEGMTVELAAYRWFKFACMRRECKKIRESLTMGLIELDDDDKIYTQMRNAEGFARAEASMEMLILELREIIRASIREKRGVG